MFIFFIQFGLSADSTKVLIIGSNHDLGDKYGSDSAAFSPTDIANKLKEILSQNGQGTATVTVEERYNDYNPSGFVYNGHTFQSRSYNLTGWFHYPLPAGAEEARWANLRGEGGTVWDYVVIIGDPYTMEKTPGMYAQGVAKVAEEVAKGADPAEVILLMNWPASASSSTVDHYKEIVYRAGRSGGYKVAPAALAWQAAGSPSGASHPNADGAYIAAASIYSRIYNQSASNSGYNYNDSLADTVQTTVETNVGQPQYSGDFNFINPYLMLGDKRRDVHFSENGTSTEEDFKNAAKSAMDRSRVTYNTIDYCPNGSSSSASYNSNTPEDDGLGWPVGNEMPIAWNHGRTYPDGRIKLNPDYWQLGLGYEYQWNTSSYSDEIANDHYIAMMDYYDTNRANDRLADAAIGARWMPTRMLWAQMHKEYPALDPMRDSNHLNWDQTHAVGTYMYTLYSGRCPLDPEPSPMTSRWMAQKIGYETAWRMGRCQTRAPGFKVMPSAASAKTVTPTSSDTMSVQFIMAPTHDVTVNISTSDALKGKVSPSQLTFTPANYNVPQTVTVIGETGVAGSFEFDAQFSTTSTDPVYDGLSDTWTYTNTRTQGLSQILGNDVVIENGDTTPDLADDTDFGYVDASLTKVFTIFNQSATDTVNLTDSPRVTLSDESGNFTLSQDTASSAIAPLGSTNFSITYDATTDLSGGLHTAAVSISSSDPLLPTYTFTVQALSPGQPAVINVGATGGQLSATLEGQLSAGTRADAIIYWGTTDGGATPGNWENSQSFTAVTEGNNFSAELTGLVAGRQYYYRVFASNSKGEAWSESTELFMTEAPVALPSTPVRWGAPAKYWSIEELNPALWLDASDASTITQSGGAVSQWADKSGNNRDATQTDGSLKPTYTLSSMNGQDVLTFDGSDDHLNVDLDFLAGVSHSAFIVTKAIDYGIIYGATNGFSGAQSFHAGFRDSNNYMMNIWGDDYDQAMSANFNAGQVNLVNYVWTSGSDRRVFANGYLEGNSGSAGVVGTMAGGGMIGGAVVEVGNYFGGDIAEMIIVTGDVDADTRENIEGYLAWKWGLESSLPVDHPYASEPPASAEHMVTADVNMSAADSYNTTTPISPDLGVKDYYLTDITNRTPVIYGAHQAGLTIKSDVTQGYAELAEEMIVGGRTKAMMVWKKVDFLAERSVTLTRFKLELFGPADLSYENRWVVEKDGQFYISDQTFSAGNQDVDASTLTWSEYTPLNGGSDTIGASATISLHDLDSIGFYVNAERTANSGDSWMRTSLYYFAVDGDEDPDLSATVNYVTYEAGPNGSITGTATQEVIYDGSTTAVTATPAAGYEFVNWSDGSTANPRSDANVTSSQTYTSNFALAGSNLAPTANAGADQTVVDTDDSGSESITLDASASIDSDGSIASYVWTENVVQIATGVNPAVDLAVGTHTITLTVTDDDGATATDTVVVTVNEPVVIEQPTITDAEDEIYVNGETVTVSGANFNTDSKVYISADATLDESAVLQSEMVIADGASLTFTVNRGTISEGNMYLFVTNDADITGGADAALTSDATPIQVGHLWTPADITTEAWFDASDASTITESGGLVSQWDDKSGNNNHATQGTASSQPALVGDQLNFDGSDDHLDVDLDFLAGVSHSAFIVTKVTDYGIIYGATNGFSGAQSFHEGFRDSNNYMMNIWGDDYDQAMSANFHAGQVNLVNYVWTSGSDRRVFANGYLEGNSGSAGVVGTMAGGGMIGGGVVEVGTYFGGDIAEMIILTGDVEAETRQKIEGYLAWKWGLESNLPEEQPYKSGVAIAYGLAPSANAGANQTLVDTDSSGSESVTLDASASSDSDGTIASYVWTENAVQIATGVNPTVDLAVGTHTITLTVIDDDGATATDTVVVTVNEPIVLREPENPANVVNGINWERYLGTWDMLPDFDVLTSDASGTASTIQLGLGEPTYDYGYRFTGYVDVPTDGVYTFYTASDDGSKLYIGGTEVVSNDGLHAVVEKSGTIALKAGKHAITVTFFQKGGGYNLAASYEGPGITKQAIPAAALYRIAAANNAPVANNGSVTTNEDTAVVITLEAHDPEGDFLVYTITTWPNNGTFVQNGGEGTYTPYAGYTGPDSLTFTVNDGEFTSDQATVSIEVLGNAPVIDTAASATPNTIYEFDSTALTVSASDPDGDVLSYTWSKVSGPGTATFDAPASDFTLVSFSAVGSYVLRVTVSDGNQSVTSDVTVTVNGNASLFTHVESITCSTTSNKRKYGVATIVIKDDQGAPVEGATVSGDFSGSYNESVQGVTDANGSVTFQTSSRNKSPSFTFTVTDVSHASLGYDPASNVVFSASL